MGPHFQERGYLRPSWEPLFVSERFFIIFQYDPRDSLSVRFGEHKANCASEFIREEDIDIYKDGHFYGKLMEAAGLETEQFYNACGEYTSSGIRCPNLELVFSMILASLSKVEKTTLNNEINRTKKAAGFFHRLLRR